jgi:hypothetical protein
MRNYIVTTRTKYGLKQFRYYGVSSVEAVKKIHLKAEAMPERCIIDISEIQEPVKNNHTYGIISENSGYIDTSNSLLGAKNHATRNGYTQVYTRFNSDYVMALASDKTLGYWVDSKDFEKFFDGVDLDCSLYLAVNSVLDGVLTLKQAVDEYEYKGL